MSFSKVLNKYRFLSHTQRDKGDKFERLMQRYLQTDPVYADELKHVWLWVDFPYKSQLGGIDLGIDLVAEHINGGYWAIQCKCYDEKAIIDKPKVDSFIATANRSFTDDAGTLHHFSYLLWISTTDKWGDNALETLKGQRVGVGVLYKDVLENSAVDWEKLEEGIHGLQALKSKKSLRDHQKSALDSAHEYFIDHERGKLIMACGTGKTYTALKIAEHETKNAGTILFLVPSIALLGQTLREWKADSEEEFHAICICSDPTVSQKRVKKTDSSDAEYYQVADLAYPASTNVADIKKQFQMIHQYGGAKGMTVVFSTYQSIDVIAEAQKVLLDSGLPEFDLIICDEAHRTTGVTLGDTDESAFVKVHNNEFINSKKRLYMTATPRLFSDDSKSKAAQANVTLCSMDDPAVYGEEIYRIGFGEAVEKGLLTDYKVLILTLNEANIPPAFRSLIAKSDSELSIDLATQLIGCITALSKQVLGDNGIIAQTDPEPMRRAVAFCSSIKASQQISNVFNEVSDTYLDSLPEDRRGNMISLKCQHIDGSMTTPDKDRLLGWLKSEPKDNECHVLTNVRVLSEGVDVPSLDSIIFLSTRNSQIDVVQSVGRVMRKAPNKKYGYIIIPVLVPSDVEPEVALDNTPRFQVIWSVLNALRAHDDRFNATVNKIELNKAKPDIIISGAPKDGFDPTGEYVSIESASSGKTTDSLSQQMMLQFEDLKEVLYAKMVQKVGDRRYWEQWAKNVAEIAERQVERIKRLIADNGKHQQAFQGFIEGLRKNINPSISEQEGIDMLSQHIITKPVFDALFEGYSFVSENAISKSMQNMLDLLEEQAIEKDTQTLDKFYESVKMRAQGIDNAEGKQKIIIELYDKFFKTAFPKMVEQLGIVYTPTECVDFILHSVNDILKKEFGRSISDENIHVLDPFTGTGTFMTRLIQSGLIEQKDLIRKYQHELHANEIVLLAYYIATINIENAFHDMTPEDDGIGTDTYIPFEGIVLTDTFQLGETEDGNKIFSDMFPQNSERVQKQMQAPLRVIFGNPPYSVGQKSANDNAQNQSHPILEKRIENTYIAGSDVTQKKSLYDSYFKAFRWATDKLNTNEGGIVSFISNGAWLESNSAEGFRKSLEKEFSSIYVFNLRGNQRTSGELSRKEGGKIFGSGSRTPISITLLVKNPSVTKEKADIYYHDIGDYLNREQKLDIIKKFGSVANETMVWKSIKTDEHGDWFNFRNSKFESHFRLDCESKYKKESTSYFITYSLGLSSNRAAWVYNYSRSKCANNMERTIQFYNQQRNLIDVPHTNNENIKKLISYDPKMISWTSSLIKNLSQDKELHFNQINFRIASYRPFQKQFLYADKNWIEQAGHQLRFFPNDQLENKIITTPGIGSIRDFSVSITNCIRDLDTYGGVQCFPLYYYEENSSNQEGMFEQEPEARYTRKDGISDYIHEKALQQYGLSTTGAGTISKEDIFYYVYGFLHSPEYREKFANDLKKMLPRIPLVESVKDFWAFSQAGRKLADLHINYEAVAPYPDVEVINGDCGFYEVEKMRFPKKDQKDIILYNSKITVCNIPEKAYQYVVNGKSAIEWIMERYQITTHKDSGITNNPNDWSKEVGNPRYILDLLLSIINVSVQTVDIVESLPKVEFGE
jgi:predicted helicase